MTQIRTTFTLDAVTSGALGVLLIALAKVLENPLGLPVTLSVVVGLGLLTWAGFVTWVSIRQSHAMVLDVIILNLVWVTASVAFVIGWSGLTGWGVVFVLAQASAVAALTLFQVAARRTMSAPVPA